MRQLPIAADDLPTGIDPGIQIAQDALQTLAFVYHENDVKSLWKSTVLATQIPVKSATDSGEIRPPLTKPPIIGDEIVA